MYYLKCKHCNRLNEVKSEYMVVCGLCNRKLEDNFKDWKGCTLKEIYYAGDNEARFKEITQQYGGKEAIVLKSTFNVDETGGDGSLNPNSTYEDFSWLLIRNQQGEWQEVDHGY